MAEHTPLPWFAVNIGDDDDPMWSVMAARIAGRPAGPEVARCDAGDSPQEMETANAAFIVKACNCHEALVSALNESREWLRACLELVEHGGPPDWDGIRAHIKTTNAILAKARGETP